MQYVIIGNSAAGIAAAATIRARDPEGRILVFSDEQHAAYYRPLIPALIEDGTGRSSLFREQPSMPQAVEVRVRSRAERIDRKQKKVTLDGGESLPYDRLLLATGASAARPSIPGLEGSGVHVLRTVSDAEKIRAASEKSGRAVIIGGGRVGIKAALALAKRRVAVTVVEQAGRLVPLQLDDQAAEIVRSAVEAQGIELVLGQTVLEVRREAGDVTGVLVTGGRKLDADLIVVATGIQPNINLAGDAGLDVSKGIVVNSLLQTTDPEIYAAGDAVETADIITGESILSGTWTDAVVMGRVAGTNISGGNLGYPGSLAVQNALEVAGVPTVSVGMIEPPDVREYEVLAERRGNTYRKLVLKNGRLVGALMVGEIEGSGIYTGLIKRRANVGPHMESLLARRPSSAAWLKLGDPVQASR